MALYRRTACPQPEALWGLCDVSCQLLSYLQKIILASLEVVNNS